MTPGNATGIPIALLLASFWTASLCATSAVARESDLSQPIDVSADRSEYDERSGTQTLVGNVEIRQGTLLITADRIDVGLDDSRLASIDGTGSPIRFEQENDAGETIRGEARRISYDATNGTLVLTGEATLVRPGQRLSSERIAFDARTQTVSAEGAEGESGARGRVNIRIEPPPAEGGGR